MMKAIRPIAAFSIFLFAFTGCSNDVDNNGGNNSTPASQETFFETTFNGTTYRNATVVSTPANGSLEIVATYNPTTVASADFLEILEPGTYSSNIERGFSLVIGSEVWFCNEGCTFTITEHNPSTGIYAGTISGIMQNLLGTSSAQLEEVSFRIDYNN